MSAQNARRWHKSAAHGLIDLIHSVADARQQLSAQGVPRGNAVQDDDTYAGVIALKLLHKAVRLVRRALSAAWFC